MRLLPGPRLSLPAAALILGLAFWASFWPPEAQAHGVYIFGWAEGSQICTDSYFTRTSKVQGGTVTVKDRAGRVLAQGLTDSQGGVCFPRPQAEGDFLFDVEAGEGHRAEFILRAEELPAMEEPAAAGLLSESSPAESSPAAETAAGTAPAAAAPDPADPALENKIREIVRQELQTQLAPLTRTLAESRISGPPGVREIAGGLGWLAGAFALGSLLTSRKSGKN